MYDPTKQLTPKKGIKDCCLDENNLERTRVAEDKVIDICKVCSCKHYRFFCETANLGSDFAKLNSTTLTNENQ